MKKKLWLVGCVVAVTIVGGVLLQACSSIREVSAPRFLELAKETQEVHSARSTRFMCVTGQRVYLEYWGAPFLFGSGMTIYWTRLADLPEELSTELRAGKNPWKPPEIQAEGTGR